MGRRIGLALFGLIGGSGFVLLALLTVVLPYRFHLTVTFWTVLALLAVVVYVLDRHDYRLRAKKIDFLYYYYAVGLPFALVWVWAGVSWLGPIVMGYTFGGLVGTIPGGVRWLLRPRPYEESPKGHQSSGLEASPE